MQVLAFHIIRSYKTSALRLRPALHPPPNRLRPTTSLKFNRNMATKVEKTEDEWRAILSREQVSLRPDFLRSGSNAWGRTSSESSVKRGLSARAPASTTSTPRVGYTTARRARHRCTRAPPSSTCVNSGPDDSFQCLGVLNRAAAVGPRSSTPSLVRLLATPINRWVWSASRSVERENKEKETRRSGFGERAERLCSRLAMYIDAIIPLLFLPPPQNFSMLALSRQLPVFSSVARGRVAGSFLRPFAAFAGAPMRPFAGAQMRGFASGVRETSTE